jgi:hypothetical protein
MQLYTCSSNYCEILKTPTRKMLMICQYQNLLYWPRFSAMVTAHHLESEKTAQPKIKPIFLFPKYQTNYLELGLWPFDCNTNTSYVMCIIL